ncbi:MAG: serine/threonine protein kinase [Planctomycetes bacterium]|nr:serine/threonine protein kinase [Planctomycetota bacterium]
MSGDRIAGRYQVLGALGQGAQGSVLLALDEQTQREVALKTLAEERVTPALAAVLRAEFEHLRSLDHPGLVRVLEFVVAEGRPYLVLERVGGEELTTWAARGDRVERALEIAEPLLRALSHLHRRGLCHLDVKPAHVLVAEGGQPVLLDLGLAARPGEVAEGGTPGYAAPEVLLGFPVDRRADLYGLGVTLLEACGSPLEALPQNARAFLERLLASDRNRRPSSAGEALAELSVARGVPSPAESDEGLLPIEGSLRGREAALAHLHEAEVALVTGLAGAGRSRLLREASLPAAREGALVLWVDFARGHLDDLGALAPLLTRFGVPLSGGDANVRRARILVEAGRRLLVAAEAQPLLVGR